MIKGLLSPWLLAFALLPRLLTADQIGRRGPDPGWSPLSRALEITQKTRDLSPLKAELKRFFAAHDRAVKESAVLWLGEVKRELSGSQLDELEMLFVELNPADSMSYGFRVEMANRHLEEGSVEERKEIYLRAVREGSVKLEGVEELSRHVALARAASEGIEGFEPLIAQYSDEINRASPQLGYERAKELLWYLQLRAGANSRSGAVGVHARRLREMDSQRLSELMKKDPAFRKATESTLVEACAAQVSAALSGLRTHHD